MKGNGKNAKNDDMDARLAAILEEAEAKFRGEEEALRLEAELVAAKEQFEPGSDELRAVKDRVREARRAQRSGDPTGTANPAAIDTTAGPKEN